MSATNILKRQVALPAGTTADESMSTPIDLTGLSQAAVWITGTGTTSSGVITLEEADYDPAKQPIYGGTWSLITTVNASDVTGGVTKAIHLPAFALPRWLRVRVSTAIGGGGSIEVTVTGS